MQTANPKTAQSGGNTTPTPYGVIVYGPKREGDGVEVSLSWQLPERFVSPGAALVAAQAYIRAHGGIGFQIVGSETNTERVERIARGIASRRVRQKVKQAARRGEVLE